MTEKISEDVIKEQAKKVHELFVLVNDKDFFRDIFQKLLSQRLLGNNSASNDAEMTLLGDLKQAEGMQFTLCLENMVKDYRQRDESMSRYPAQWLKEGRDALLARDDSAGKVGAPQGTPFEFDPRVLCTGYWPTTSIASHVPAPLPMQAAIDHHNKAYSVAHQDNRVVKFAMHEGQVELVFRPGSKPYTVIMSTLQCIVALAVQNLEMGGKPATIGALCTDLRLEIPVLKNILDPIMHPKLGANILTAKLNKSIPKEARVQSGGLHAEDAVRINSKFVSKNRKVTATVMPLEKSQRKQASANRGFVLDACIVRVMKARKTMLFNELVTEVVRQVKLFQADVRQCKIRIDDLVGKEYLERDEDDMRKLHYIA